MKRIHVFIIAAMALLYGCGKDTDVEAYQQELSIVELAILDSIGVEIGDSNYVLGAVQKLDRDSSGNILVLDRSACCVRIYSPEGEFIRNVSNMGSGPGELNNPLDMFVLENDRIMILSPWSGGLHAFTTEGEWLGLVNSFTNDPPMAGSAADDSAYVASRLQVETAENGELVIDNFLGRYELGDEPVVKYSECSFPFDPTDMTSILRNTLFSYTFSADKEGNVFMADLSCEEYLVEGFRSDGELFLDIEKDAVRVEKTPEEMAEEKRFVESWVEAMGADGVVIEWNPEPYRYMISQIQTDGIGRIWVRRGTELTPVFDVYDYQGNELFTASVPEAGDEGQFWMFHIDEYGIVAYSTSPELFQQVFIVEMP